MTGLIIIDKPKDFTSFDVVAIMRKLFKQKKIGHTGTLDPLATGVLPILLGSATKALSILPDDDKEYIASFRLGLVTDTEDITGKVLSRKNFNVDTLKLEKILENFRGNIMQIPPMYSALNKDGKRLYEFARKGIKVERKPRLVNIKKLELLRYDLKTGEGSLKIACSKGTYIRTICADIGEKLNCGAVMTEIRRIKASGFSLCDSIKLDEAKNLFNQDKLFDRVLKIQKVFECYPKINITDAQSIRFLNGGSLLINRTEISINVKDKEIFRVFDPKEIFLGLGIVNVELKELSVFRIFKS